MTLADLPDAGSSDARPKRRRDAATTRAGLLAAARAEFSAKGLAGARVDEIAAAAGVNKQLVYHYFTDKDGLYLAVIESIYAELRADEARLRLGDLAPEVALTRLIERSFDYLATHPDFIALLNDENRMQASHVGGSARLQRMHSPLVAAIADILSRGVAAGIFRPGVDPMQLYISIAALGYFYFSNQGTLSAIFQRKLAGQKAVKARRRHVVETIMLSLRP